MQRERSRSIADPGPVRGMISPDDPAGDKMVVTAPSTRLRALRRAMVPPYELRCEAGMGIREDRASSARGRAFAAVLAFFGLAGTAAAGEWPSRPLTLILPFAPGRPSDVARRLIGA